MADTAEIEKRITNEKPISLHPLEFEEALAALLQTNPPPKECKPKSDRKEQEGK